MERPFFARSIDTLRAIGCEAYEERNVPRLRAALAELSGFRTTGEARRLLEQFRPLLSELEVGPNVLDEPERTCGNVTCSRVTRGWDDFYCQSCSSELWLRIHVDLAAIEHAADEQPGALYLGRTALPERRLLEHLQDGRDRLSILHWANSLEEAEQFERNAFDLVRNSAKVEQNEPRRNGRFSRGHHAIYASWRLHTHRSADLELAGASVVRTLAGRRCWPAPVPSFRTEHLSSPLNERDAAQVLGRFDAKEADYLDWRRSQR
jgi:hypothetical protein